VEKTIESKRAWGLLRRRQVVVPTWKGWLLLAVVLGPVALFAIRGLHSFLMVNAPVTGGVLVVEGWAPDYALQSVVEEFKRDRYEHVYVTGGPIEFGAPLMEYKTYAERGAAILVKYGLATNLVQAVPAPFVAQDRTYMAAMTLRRWWHDRGITPTRVQLITEGLHARRSRLMFQRALGKQVQVGVSAIGGRDYDPEHWWRYSAGVRGVIGETVAYLYAVVLFHPGREP
jgi:uncharacterized SAM-binding protein YcdF (DUF218 family)